VIALGRLAYEDDVLSTVTGIAPLTAKRYQSLVAQNAHATDPFASNRMTGSTVSVDSM